MIEAFDYWKAMNEKLSNEQDLSVFKTWEPVLDVPLYAPWTPTHGDGSQTNYIPENISLISHSQYSEEWLNVLSLGEPKRGHTNKSISIVMKDNFCGYKTSYWIMKTIHHILTFEEQREKSIIDYEHIIEFGAGIGETARMIFDRGYQGSYTILDLPSVGRISNYYLDGKAKILNDIDQLDHNFFDPSKSLFIATWSISEVPESLRWKVAQKIVGYDQIIAFQRTFKDFDNFPFFLEKWPLWTKTFQRYKQMTFHTANNGNSYLIGKGN